MNDDPTRILIIDDNTANLKVATMHLSNYTYVVLTARDGESGLRRARHAMPDLILLDIQMPGIDGYETCRRLKADPVTADIPIIYMTARAQVDDKLRAFELGGVDYITKPFEASELIARVQNHLQIVHQKRQISKHAEELQARVAEATEQLRGELAERRALSAEREALGALVRLQSEQLYEQTRRWLETREDRDIGLAQRLRVDIAERIRLALEQLHRTQQAHPLDGIARTIELLTPALSQSQDVGESLRETSAPIAPIAENPLIRLSPREYEVFQLLTQGKANKEIAYTLGISTSTVSTYRLRILEKLDEQDISGLIRIALQFQPPPQTGAR
ncbi:MAG: response regulator [Myxococcota bacterium]